MRTYDQLVSAIVAAIPQRAEVEALRVSERMKNAALELAEIAEIGPREVNQLELAKIAARILRVADQVAIGERSIVRCPNCETDLPEGCAGTFKDSDGDACWLNR